ncbi:MAG TPA: prolyl oligopeptidase family serine peptidase [Blastocatellia bacterium]|nr:prolyl oligopeptidase family serine peptidase [Blastocatellia bacterium]
MASAHSPASRPRQRVNLVLAAAAVFLLFTSAAAQDAAQVLRLSVGYRTAKNSANLTAETQAEVDQIAKLAQEASAAQKYGDALKHYYHAIAVIRGNAWTPAREWSNALAIKLDKAVLEPGDALRLTLNRIYIPDQKLEGKLTGSVGVSKTVADDPSPIKTVDPLSLDTGSTALSVDLTAPQLPDGVYRIAFLIKQGNPAAEPITFNTNIRVEKGLAARVAAAKSRADKLAARLKETNKDKLLAALPSGEYRISMYDLANSFQIGADRINFTQELQETDAILGALESGLDPFATRKGDFRKAYRSKVDNTLQPYRIFVPAAYDGSKAYPLIIALHGMGGDENSYFDLYGSGAFKKEADRRGYIVACPKGRNPASLYIGTAERDVIDVLDEVRHAYNIDPSRIYLTGHSMGGYGTWSVAMNHPDIFAALAPISGGGSPPGMAKIARIPQLVVHGDNDKTVPVSASRVMVEAGRKLNTEIKYIEIPGGDHVSVALRTFGEVFDWFDAHKRNGAEAAAGASGNSHKR